MSRKYLAVIFIFFYMAAMGGSLTWLVTSSTGSLAAMCLENSLPAMELAWEEEAEPEKKVESSKVTTVAKSVKSDGKPQVLIYHTHATESYLPSSQGNYHVTKEENTVRDAAGVLTEVLEEEGISVIHDKTLHDNPSYNNSYSRSYETVKEVLAKYPSITCIIDLHRDATAADVAGPVQEIEGKRCAVYSYVISNTTDTYASNQEFLSKLNAVANENYEGYTGKILERPYWYNQELCSKAVLIEMGNNRNNIEEVRNCARVYGKILAEALQEE